MIRSAALIVALLLGAATPAAATELYCRQMGHMSWDGGVPVAFANTEGEWGGSELWIDTVSGDWRQRFIGSRALYTGGGTYEVLNDGTGYRADWVGVTPELAEMMRINIQLDPSPYLRVLRDQAVESGTCITPGTDVYIDGVLIQ